MKHKKKLSRAAVRRRVWIFLVLAIALAAFAVAAPYLTPNDPNATNSEFMKAAPCAHFPLGTDKLGRCVLSRVMMGARTSIFSSLCVVAASFVFGTALGALCGWYGGALDEIVMRVVDILLAFPQMVLAIAVAGVLGGSLLNAMIAMGITGWTLYARLARSAVMTMKKEPYIAAAKLSGCRTGRLIIRHVLPNIFGPLLVNAATQIGTMMIGIAGLSFLGIGVTPPQAEWGSMINEARAYMQLAPWTVLAPGGAMLITVMIFNYLGDSVRDLLDAGGQNDG